jgi:NAD(P)-dependent dehydrogenase (short-subunit alcohol dehydrogenase family)
VRHFVITGANTGIGREAARAIARGSLVQGGVHLTLACRSREKTQAVVDELARESPQARVEVLALDLGDLASVRAAAAELRTRGNAIDILVNNAGVGGQRGLTRDGFELHFGTNHVGHYLFTRLLLDLVRERIVTVASNRHREAKGIDWHAARATTTTITGRPEYAVSKLANLLFHRALTRRLGVDSAIHTYAMNPGKVATDVFRRVPQPFRWLIAQTLTTAEQGASYVVDLAVSEARARETGRYYDVGREQPMSPQALDDRLADELWERSAAWVGLAP